MGMTTLTNLPYPSLPKRGPTEKHTYKGTIFLNLLNNNPVIKALFHVSPVCAGDKTPNWCYIMEGHKDKD